MIEYWKCKNKAHKKNLKNDKKCLFQTLNAERGYQGGDRKDLYHNFFLYYNCLLHNYYIKKKKLRFNLKNN